MGLEKMPISKDTKREIVKLLLQPGSSVEWISRDLGIDSHLLRLWLRQVQITSSASKNVGV